MRLLPLFDRVLFLHVVNSRARLLNRLSLEGIGMALLGMRTSIQRHFCHTVQPIITFFSL